MYIDDGTDPNEGELKVDVDGHEYTAEANADITKDGVVDSYVVQTDTGVTVYADTDGDGQADTYAELSESGETEYVARYDPDGHSWVSSEGSSSQDSATQASADSAGSIHVEGPKGDMDAGKPTIDSDHDGKPDTAVADDGHGGKVLATDADGDGKADQITEIDAEGKVTVSVHEPDGQWTVQERGHLDEQGQYHKDGGGEGAGQTANQLAKLTADPASDAAWGGVSSGDGVARIDAATGQWISRN